MTRPLVIGHRGFPFRHPDNSLSGVRAALDIGADGVEVDVRPCREGTWVCHHDLRSGGTAVCAAPLSALARAGTPTLADVVAAVPRDRWLYVEVKPLPLEALEPCLEELAALLGPRALRTRLLSSSLPVLTRLADVLDSSRSWVLDRMPLHQPPDVDLSPHHPLVERLLPLGRALHPWTVNRASRMVQLAALRVGSITTNRPDVAREVLG